ncbi:MAG: II family cellulose-binding protein [Zetaproteobacteria bacterium]|nr:II family cellulose-binding protein [Pseudobdellovibrionaceae bacterium]
MDFTIDSPALLFPAICLLLIAFTNKYLGIVNRIHKLHATYHQKSDELLVKQLWVLRRKASFIISMQASGIISLFLCVVSIIFLFFEYKSFANGAFVLSVLCLGVSLIFALREVIMSAMVLDLELSDVELKSQKVNLKSKLGA